MATFDVSPLFQSTSVGFDQPLGSWSTTMGLDSSADPPYNILKLDQHEFRISLAVPGLRQEEINIETNEGSLWVSAKRTPDPDHNRYLYKGIGLEGFQRSFQLPEHVKVKNARLEMGLLHIDLVREVPEELRPRRIEIESSDKAQPVLEDASKAA